MRTLLYVTGLLAMIAATASADQLDDAKDQLKELELRLELSGDDLSQQRLSDLVTTLEEALDIVKGEDPPTNEYRCFASQSQAGKYYLSTLSSPSSKIGNYFSDAGTCEGSLAAMGDNMLCFESVGQPGKAFYSNLDSPNGKIGYYYSNMANCIDAFGGRTDDHICMESISKPGKWFIANVLSGVTINAPYLDSLFDCNNFI